jgi:hypothetical protein
MRSPEVDDMTREDWRRLGFFYDVDEPALRWILRGSRNGLRGFAARLRAYADDARHARLGEHDHLGPYMYLKLMTADAADLTSSGIAGRLEDFRRLAELLQERVANAAVGDRVRLRSEFAPSAHFELELCIEPDEFDPSSADPLVTTPESARR